MRRFASRLMLATAIFAGSVQMSSAETIFGALAKAYENNSSLNSARAGVRIADENVPLAKSGYRPRITGSAGITNSATNYTTGVTNISFGITIQQSIFDGFQTRNNVRAAEAGVRAERANLQNTEQNTLYDAAAAYADILQARAIAGLRSQNLKFLNEQLRSARARFDVGEGTRTDVAQAEASLASAQAALTAANTQLEAAKASYRLLTGSDAPSDMKAPSPLSKLLPGSLDGGLSLAFSQHPAILVRDALIDSQLFSVKVAEGAFLPSVGLSATVSRNNSITSPTYISGIEVANGRSAATSAQIGVQVTVPIYQGGQASAALRKQKETLGQARIDKDVARDQVRQAVTSAWYALDAARAGLNASNEGIRASKLALSGVVEERDVGQRTTLDVLNAQATLISAQISAVQAQRDLVVASYALASSVGNLTAQKLGLNVKHHDPKEHYEQVKDLWYGLRTPDGR